MRFTYILLVLLAAITGTLHAEIYKWEDDNGNIVYSQTPPPLNAKMLNVPFISQTPQQQRVTSPTTVKDKPQKPTEQPDTKANEDLIKQQQESIKEACKIRRNNLRILELTARVYTTDSAGERHYLSEEEQAEKIKEYKDQIKRHCSHLKPDSQ